MAKRQGEKKLQLEYCHDRLAKRKLGIVYELLLPPHAGVVGNTDNELTALGEPCHEDGGDLYASFFRETKGRENHR